MRKRQPRRTAGLAAVALAITASMVGCVQEKVDMKARELAHIKKDLRQAKETVKTEVQEQAERAKAGVAKLNEKLPALKEGAREGLEHAKEGLLETRDKVVQTVRSTLNSADEKVDQAVDKAKQAGE
ncbi:MAG: hypothetical protein JWN48_3471 [Myxococcaceae bacterium]|nr:hypothetical protein [Myxococcaceae bacterium]